MNAFLEISENLGALAENTDADSLFEEFGEIRIFFVFVQQLGYNTSVYTGKMFLTLYTVGVSF